MSEISLREIITFFNPDSNVRVLPGTREVALGVDGQHRTMDSKTMMREWREMSDEDKRQIKAGLTDKSLTYA